MSELGPINDMLARGVIGAPEPCVGIGATLLYPSDRYPYTIIEVSPRGDQFIMQRDRAVRPDGDTGSQRYTYEPNPLGDLRLVRRSKEGFWYTVSVEQEYQVQYHDEGWALRRLQEAMAKRRGHSGRGVGTPVRLGDRSMYQDPSA